MRRWVKKKKKIIIILNFSCSLPALKLHLQIQISGVWPKCDDDAKKSVPQSQVVRRIVYDRSTSTTNFISR